MVRLIINEDSEEMFTIGPDDVVMIFRADGSEELAIPNMPGDKPVGEPCIKALLVSVLFSDRLESDRIREELSEIAMEPVKSCGEGADYG